jgi:AcrR family transcriptional regulator
MAGAATAPARRPGGRSALVRRNVYTAVGELVGEGLREGMSIPQVAERAGVNPTSIYRRWGNIEALLEEVAVAALTRDEPMPDTGSIAGDLRAWAGAIAADIARPQRRTYLRAMIYARNDRVDHCPCWDQRMEQAEQMIRRARQRGERTPSAAQVLDHVVAPLYHHAVFGLAVDADYAAALVSDVLALAPGGTRSRR